MQSIVDAIRATGSTHVILLGGVQYSNALTQWLAHKPNDPLGQLGAAWHLYNFNACVSATCWDVGAGGGRGGGAAGRDRDRRGRLHGRASSRR